MKRVQNITFVYKLMRLIEKFYEYTLAQQRNYTGHFVYVLQ